MKKQEIIDMISEVDFVSKKSINTIALLDNFCAERGYELIKMGQGEYRLREFEAIEDWTKPLKFVYENFDKDWFSDCGDFPVELANIMSTETHGFLDLRILSYILNHKSGDILDFGPVINKIGGNDWIIDLDILAAYGILEEDYDSIWVHNYFFDICSKKDTFVRPHLSRQAGFKCYVNGKVEQLKTKKSNFYWDV